LIDQYFLPARRYASGVLAIKRWLSVCSSHAGTVSKRTQPILKRFRPFGSPIIPFFLTRADTQLQG